MKHHHHYGESDELPRLSSTNPNPEDHLTPSFDCSDEDRPSTVLIGIFNLIASIVGGGVLSLPIVFSKCGIFFTTISMVLSAYITYMSLAMLCYSSRRRGGSSYGEVMRSAFGERMEEAVSWLLFIFLMFVIVGYMVLIRDIWTPLVKLTPLASTLGANDGDYVLMSIIVLLMPFLLQRSLHSLRYNCYFGFLSVMVLCFALCRGALLKLNAAAPDVDATGSAFELDYFKIPSVQELLFSFPIVTCSFLCHFNVNSIQNALHEPTRQRMQNLLQYAISTCFIIMYLLGLSGYLYAGEAVDGNILNNVPIGTNASGQENDQIWLFTLGRLGIGLTIVLALPLMALPCRDSLLEIVDVWFHRSHHRLGNSTHSIDYEEGWCWNLFHRCNRNESMDDAAITTEDEVLEEVAPHERTSLILRHEPIQKDYIFRNTFAHFSSTMLIIAICYFGAVSVRGVAYVWSFIGSSMAFVIAFILPCGSFIVIEDQVPAADRKNELIITARLITIFSVVGAITCTANSLF